MLKTLEWEGASFLQLAKACLTQERRMNMTRGLSPMTWEQGTMGCGTEHNHVIQTLTLDHSTPSSDKKTSDHFDQHAPILATMPTI
jgi:hypothetical protein